MASHRNEGFQLLSLSGPCYTATTEPGPRRNSVSVTLSGRLDLATRAGWARKEWRGIRREGTSSFREPIRPILRAIVRGWKFIRNAASRGSS